MNDGMKKNIVYGSSSMIVLAVCGYYFAFSGSAGPRDAGGNGAVAQVRHRVMGEDKAVKKTRKRHGPRDRKPIEIRVRTSADVKHLEKKRRAHRRNEGTKQKRTSPPM